MLLNLEADFEPSAARGAALDSRMRERLADSLTYIFSITGELHPFSSERIECLIAAIRKRRQSAALFGTYHDIVLALEREDLPDARRLMSELVELVRYRSQAFRVADIAQRPLAQRERLERLFLGEGWKAEPCDPGKQDEFEQGIYEALELLDRGFPNMFAEIRALLSEIVLAKGAACRASDDFDGASAFMLWGAILLNCNSHISRLDAAQALVHESGHNVLFGFCADGPLVTNEEWERFGSPLRRDARPMDGVVHATYVVARMHQTLSRLLGASVLTQEEVSRAIRDMRAHEQKFAIGERTILDHGRLTEVGAAALSAAQGYMADFKR